MIRHGLLLLVAVILASPAARVQVPAAAPPAVVRAENEVDVNHGRFVALGTFFQEQKWACVRCHGLEGEANGSGAFPRLTDQSAWYLYKSLRDYAVGLRPNDIMGPIARTLTSEEMRNVAAFYAAVDDAPYPGELSADRQLLEYGEAIAMRGVQAQGVPACVECHGPAGIGGGPIYPYLAGQFAPYLELQLMEWRRGRRDGDPLNVMELIAKAMTPAQIRAVSVYFAALRPPEVTPAEASDLATVNAWNLPVPDPVLGDVGAVRVARPEREAVVVPGVEPSGAPAPELDLPVGLPRRPLPPDALPPEYSPPPAGEGRESTTTTTGEQP